MRVRSRSVTDMPRRANVIGLGLIGGSIALALRARGWVGAGDDSDDDTAKRALSSDVVDQLGIDPDAEISFVATPVLASAAAVDRALRVTTGVVTDVGSVKAPIVTAASDPRFLGGHPMAGSEIDGLDGAEADLFNGAVWVITPDDATDDATIAAVSNVLRSMGAEVVGLTPAAHDRLVAVVSHVPHLTAASLMGVAANRAEEHPALMRLAAGGFRDMTRVASGPPDIWLDICAENRDAITAALSELIERLEGLRSMVASEDRAALEQRLTDARHARANLPARVLHPEELAEVRIPIPDRAGAAAEVFTLAAELDVNLASFEVVHEAERRLGVAVVLVDQSAAELFRGGLMARGFRPAVHPLA